MNVRVSKGDRVLRGTIDLTASKSLSNRLLIIRALAGSGTPVKNLAPARDTSILNAALESHAAGGRHFDIGHAGTAMRFLTGYLACMDGESVITGSERMQKRPIGILVDALCAIGADIEYLGEFGFPPLSIRGKKLAGGEVWLDGSVSSQFISSLLMITPALQNGLVIHFTGEVTSRPYINMTLKIMEQFGVYGQWQGNSISVSPQKYSTTPEDEAICTVEADWSSASYWYSLAALSTDCDLLLRGLHKNSLQGDAVVTDIYTFFGVRTSFEQEGVRLTRLHSKNEHFGFDFTDCPDLVQTVAVTCAALGIPAWMNGLHTLKLKETDRVAAMMRELQKVGISAVSHKDGLQIDAGNLDTTGAVIETYEDHRMALAFSALAFAGGIEIHEAGVVGKSYPDYWDDLRKAGFTVKEV